MLIFKDNFPLAFLVSFFVMIMVKTFLLRSLSDTKLEMFVISFNFPNLYTNKNVQVLTLHFCLLLFFARLSFFVSGNNSESIDLIKQYEEDFFRSSNLFKYGAFLNKLICLYIYRVQFYVVFQYYFQPLQSASYFKYQVIFLYFVYVF